MTTIAIDLPDEAFSALKQSPSAFVRDMRRADFLAALAAEQIDVFELDLDGLRRELARG